MDDVLPAVLCTEISNHRADTATSFAMPMFAQALARYPAEQLFAPEAHLAHLDFGPPTFALASRLLDPLLSLEPTPSRPAPTVKIPGRNDPCSCGSGKKFKKCCA